MNATIELLIFTVQKPSSLHEKLSNTQKCHTEHRKLEDLIQKEGTKTYYCIAECQKNRWSSGKQIN